MADSLKSSCARAARTMSRLPLLLCVIVELMSARTAVVSDHNPTLTDRLEKLFEKLESLTVAPPKSLSEKIASKIERLNSLNPDVFEEDLTDEDEELLTAMQLWGQMTPEQLGGMAKELQQMRIEGDELKSEKLIESEYSDDAWNEDDLQYYAMDGEDWDSDEDSVDGSNAATSRPGIQSVTPSSIIRVDGPFRNVISGVDPIAATSERPRILDDSSLTATERQSLRRQAVANMGNVVRAGRCLTPQPRWLAVRQLAPAADIVYMPPCVQLHRCAPDAGCCYSEAEVCAPVEGKYVILPFYLHRADGNNSVARMMFYNHTRCKCISRDTLQQKAELRLYREKEIREQDTQREGSREEWQQTEEPKLERDEEATGSPPPELRRCTCPTIFLARMLDNGTCSCVCEWSDLNKKRDCLSLSRGREHFGLRDRVCIANGDCTRPTCEYGSYARSNGRCPLRKFRRLRYHGYRKFQAEKPVL